MPDNLNFAIELLKRIPKSWSISAPELQEQMAAAGHDRSLRSVERHLVRLSDQFDIERDMRSKPYGYRWKKNSPGLNLPGLSAQESVLLTLGEKYLSHLLPHKLSKSLESHFRQARETLSHYQGNANKQDREWLNKIAIVSPIQPLIPPDIDEQIMSQVSNALLEGKWLTVDYKNTRDYQNTYRVMPLALVQQDVRIYLVCRFANYENERNLALHRIKSIKSQTLSFSYPSNFNLKKYITDGRFGIGDGRRVKLEFEIEASAGKHLLETPLAPNQEVIKDGGYLKISATVTDSEVLDRWLRGFGDSVKSVTKTSVSN